MKKTIKSQDCHFVWDPPRPYTNNPTPTVKFTGGDFNGIFAQSRADVTITAVANDRRTLTSGAIGSALERDEVRAYLKTSADTYYAVKVVRLVTGTCSISRASTKRDRSVTSATLNFAMSYVILDQLTQVHQESIPTP